MTSNSRFINEELNPCLKESDLSRQCLENENYDYNKCAVYFKNYRVCKEFWGQVKSARRMKGIKPHLPTLEERRKIIELKKKGIFVISAD